MNSKMYASLEETMQKWIDKWVETKEWEQTDFWCPDDLGIMLANSAAGMFDAVVKTSQDVQNNQ